MAADYQYKRVLLKLSGEVLAGDKGFGFCNEYIESLTGEITEIAKAGVQVAIVVGGGNLFRGLAASKDGVNRVQGDHIGMLATVMNSLALQDGFNHHGQKCTVMSAISMAPVCEFFETRRAIELLEAGHVVICAAGTGHPYFTTDTTGALRAIELKSDVLMKATKVDGIYDSDPMVNPDAVRFETISYAEVLERQLRVMDLTAISMCMDNKMPLMVFDMTQSGNIAKALRGEPIATVVS